MTINGVAITKHILPRLKSLTANLSTGIFNESKLFFIDEKQE